MPHLKSYIKNDWDFRRKLPSHIEYSSTLYSCDIVSLYTNITHELGLTALEYYIDKYRTLLPSRFTKAFILESVAFILNNNNFFFDNILYHQSIGTAMGTIFAPPYACLAIGFLEETKLYPQIERIFDNHLSSLIIEYFFRFMDDGFSPWPDDADINIFINLLNDLHPSIKLTLEAATKSVTDGVGTQKLNFLDITIILHETGHIETDIFYKATNSHEYLRYDSHHPQHIKDNIPYNLAKRIIVFCSNSDTEQLRLTELKKWLLNCGYPRKIIEKKIYSARLQGPANKPDTSDREITFVTTFSSKFESSHITKKCANLLKNTKNEEVKKVFDNTRIISALRQPKNLLHHLTKYLLLLNSQKKDYYYHMKHIFIL